MQQHHLNETQLARATNTPQPTIHRILSGQVTDPRISTLNLIARYFKVSVDQLLGNALMNDMNETTAHLTPIPVIPWNEALHAKAFIESLTPQNWRQWITVDITASPFSYALVSPTTGSMSPRFPAGSILIIDPEARMENGDLVIVHFKETDHATIREVLIDGPLKEFHSVLSDTPPEPITSEHRILGVLIQTRFSYRQ